MGEFIILEISYFKISGRRLFVHVNSRGWMASSKKVMKEICASRTHDNNCTYGAY